MEILFVWVRVPLSPIDISLGIGTEQEEKAIQLLNVDYYLKFVTDCRHTIEEMLEEKHQDGKTTSVESCVA